MRIKKNILLLHINFSKLKEVFMKRILFFICCLTISTMMFAQNSFSKELFPMLSGLQRTTCTGYHTHDTDIPGKEFTSTLSAPQEEVTINNQKYLKWGMYLLREDAGKIFVYSEIQKKDLVLYDFTLKAGDTLTTLNIDWNSEPYSVVDYPVATENYDINDNIIYAYIDTLTVTEVSTITLLDGNEYKKWKFNNGWQYVEMMGCFEGNFFSLVNDNKPVILCYLGTFLICVSQNGKRLYNVSEANIERYDLDCECQNQDTPTDIEIITAPTPSIQKIIREGQLYIIKDGKTYNVMGVEVENVDF